MLIALVSVGNAQEISYSGALALIDQSPAVRLARGELELAQRQLEVASSFVRGELSSGYTQSWGELSIPTPVDDEPADPITRTDNRGDFDPIGLSANFNVVPFGPSYEQILRARSALSNAENALRDARYQAVVDVTTSFQTVLAAQRNSELNAAALELANLTLAEAETRLAAGAATDAEVQAAQLTLQQVQNTQASVQANLAQTLSQLSITLGAPLTKVSPTLPPIKLEPLTLSEVRLEQRADVAAAQIAVEDARITRDATRREYLPSGSLSLGYSVAQDGSRVAIGAGYDTQSYQPSASLSYDPDYELPEQSPEGQRSTAFSVGVSATIPLDVAVGSALEAGRLSIERSEAQLQRTVELAGLEVETQQLGVNSNLAAYRLAQATLEQQEARLATARRRFESGIISRLELFTLRNDALGARLELLRAEHALRLAQMQLALALAVNPLEVY